MTQTMSLTRNTDHPRLCGEKLSSASQAAQKAGSPPPMRGKAYQHMLSPPFYRITPAYAGKRFSLARLKVSHWDHPRLCGEKGKKQTATLLKQGSPPPMRGKVHHYSTDNLLMRITPAYAGKRLTFTIFEFTERDHPRLCGEKFSQYIR